MMGKSHTLCICHNQFLLSAMPGALGTGGRKPLCYGFLNKEVMANGDLLLKKKTVGHQAGVTSATCQDGNRRWSQPEASGYF